MGGRTHTNLPVFRTCIAETQGHFPKKTSWNFSCYLVMDYCQLIQMA